MIILFFILLLLANPVYAVGEKWTGGATPSETSDQACAIIGPVTECIWNDTKQLTAKTGYCSAPTCSCESDVVRCSTNNFISKVTRGSTNLICPSGAVRSGLTCICPADKPAYDPYSYSCVVCPVGTVINPITKQCQQPCATNGTLYSDFESAPGETYPGSFCTNGCEVKSELVINICGAIDFPGAECSMEGHLFSYTGEMCGGDNPPPTGPTNPPSCDSDKDQVGNICYPKCTGGATRQDDMSCKCAAGQDLFRGECKAKCADNQERDGDGNCIMKSCPAGMRPATDGTCKLLECAAGETISYTLNKCVADPNQQCPEGTIKVADKCEPANNQCPNGTYWLAACQLCLQSGAPIPQCNSLSNDLDGDGQPNSSDNDMDGDGTPNSSDGDIDGDGTPNKSDTTPRGPGSSNSGPGTNDIDGDGIPNDKDGDIDGDGIPNDKDGSRNGDDNGGNTDGTCDPATQQCDPTNAGSPAAGPGQLWQQKGLQFRDVWSSFVGDLKSAPIVSAGSGFFSVSGLDGSCPNWQIGSTEFWDTITIDFQCSDDFAVLMRIMGILFLLSCAWLSFKIAFM